MIRKTFLLALVLACQGAWSTHCFAQTAFTKLSTSDNGDGTYTNPVINADFPDCDVIRVGDTYYFLSTTMFYFPGATLLKSKDLVNWEYCANPLAKILDNEDYSLLNGKNHYAQGMWAGSLTYHKGKFYIYFPCSTWSHDSQSVLLTATDPEGEWKDTRLGEAYHDPGWLFDDGENGDGYLYVACGIGDIWVNKLNPNTYQKVSSQKVISVGNGCEGSHMYHIGDYYYIYATYGGTEGSQTIFRSKKPMGPYEEHNGRVFEKQKIHQGALVQTQTGEWWTVLFKDAGSIGRVPYLEPVTWKDGWPVIGNNGKDVSANSKPYKKPDVGATYERTYLPTNDTFAAPRLGMQWQWNHNADNTAWSLSERPGYLRLHTATITKELKEARNMLTQRAFGYSPEGAAKQADTYGTVCIDTHGMQDGDVAGLCVFQDPYAFIGVKQRDGKRYITFRRSEYEEWGNMVSAKETMLTTPLAFPEGDERIYLRAILNFGTNKLNFRYSLDNEKWTRYGTETTMRYTLNIFVGNRFGIFNYATSQLGGYVDVDWFTTEPTFTEEMFYTPEELNGYTDDELTLQQLTLEQTEWALTPGSAIRLPITATSKAGTSTNVTALCQFDIADPDVVGIAGNCLVGKSEGTSAVTATYTDQFGNSGSVQFNVSVSYFPLTEGPLNPSLLGTGSYNGRTMGLTTAKDGFAGWTYNSGVDLSAYKYLIVKLRRGASCSPAFRLYDENDVQSTPFSVSMGSKREVVIDLQEMVKADGKTCDPHHIYMAGFTSTGTSTIYLSDIFLSNDGTTPATSIVNEELRMKNEEFTTVTWYDLQGRKLQGKPTKKGVYIQNGKKVVVK